MYPETKVIREAARQMVRELHLLDGSHNQQNLSLSGCHLLTELDTRKSATAKDLAEVLVLEKSTISRLCQSLTKKGLIKADPCEQDGRSRQISLTPEGKSVARRIHQTAFSMVESALEFVAESERPRLAEGMQRYAKSLRYSRVSRPFKIRKIQPTDNPAVANIIRTVMTEFGAVGEGYSINDPEVDDMYAAYRSPGSVFYVITDAKEVLGCGGIGPLSGANQDICELRKMYFLPRLRGTGMGTRLLNLCLDDARDLGYKTCYLETIEPMQQARKLYLTQGFKPLDRPLGATGHSACNAWMARPL